MELHLLQFGPVPLREAVEPGCDSLPHSKSCNLNVISRDSGPFFSEIRHWEWVKAKEELIVVSLSVDESHHLNWKISLFQSKTSSWSVCAHPMCSVYSHISLSDLMACR